MPKLAIGYQPSPVPESDEALTRADEWPVAHADVEGESHWPEYENAADEKSWKEGKERGTMLFRLIASHKVCVIFEAACAA